MIFFSEIPPCYDDLNNDDWGDVELKEFMASSAIPLSIMVSNPFGVERFAEISVTRDSSFDYISRPATVRIETVIIGHVLLNILI